MPSKTRSEPSPDELKLVLDMDGKTYVLRLGDYTGEDDQAIYAATGFTLTDIFLNDKISLFTIAALVWRNRIKTEPKLTFEAVNKAMNFSTLATVRDSDEGAEAGPEA